MDKIWEVDDANTVKTRFGTFGSKTVTVNGAEVYRSRKSVGKQGIAFSLPDGRAAAIFVNRPFVGAAQIDLRVDGALVAETPKKPLKCAACGAAAKSYDKFCAGCGKAMPTPEARELGRRVGQATSAIKWLAALFLVFGLVMFAVAKGNSDKALASLAGMEESRVLPKPIQGQTYTVGELRKAVAWEPWGVLIVNLILSAIMAALALWSRRAPLPAVLIAAATYAVVIVLNAISNPETLAQGWIVKVIIIVFLAKGIKAALELRALNA